MSTTGYPGGGWSTPAGDVVSEPAAERTFNVALGMAAGVATAVIVGAVWYLVVTASNFQIGILAVAVGFSVGFAMRYAAGRGESRSLQAVALLLTFVTMVFAEFFIARTFYGEYLVSQGDSAPLQLLVSPAVMFELVGASIAADPLTLLFWVIALTGAFRTTRSVDEPAPATSVPAAPAAQPAWASEE